MFDLKTYLKKHLQSLILYAYICNVKNVVLTIHFNVHARHAQDLKMHSHLFQPFLFSFVVVIVN